MVTPGSIGCSLVAIGTTGPCRVVVLMGTRYVAAVRAGRHRGATLAIVVVVLFLAVPLAFWLLLRTLRSDSDPPLESAQSTAHQLLRGSESIDTEQRGEGEEDERNRYVYGALADHYCAMKPASFIRRLFSASSSSRNFTSSLPARKAGLSACFSI